MRRKFFKSTFVILVTALVIITIGAHFLLPHFLAHSLSKTLGVPVDVGGMSLGYRSIEVYNIGIHNPKQSTLPYALQIGKLEVKAPLREYIQPHVNIEDVTLSDNAISVEFYSKDRKQSNWTTLLNHVNDPKDESSSIGRTIHLEKLNIYNTAVNLKFAGQKAKELPPIKSIVIGNINPESGKLTKKLTRILTNHIISSVSGLSGIHGVTGVVLKAPATAVKSIFMPFKFLFGSEDKSTETEQSQQKQSHP